MEPVPEQHIEDWTLVPVWRPYRPPEGVEQRLTGRLMDGRHVVTAIIIKIEGGCVFTSTGRCYRLGKANPAYERQFPINCARLRGDPGSNWRQ
jgi:hypothetical protein